MDDNPLPPHERSISTLCNFFRCRKLFSLYHLTAFEVCLLLKSTFSWSRTECGHTHSKLSPFFSKTFGKGKHIVFRRKIHRHERTWLKGCCRSDIENFSRFLGNHIFPEQVRKFRESSNIEINHLLLFSDICLVKESKVTKSSVIHEDIYLKSGCSHFLIDFPWS